MINKTAEGMTSRLVSKVVKPRALRFRVMYALGGVYFISRRMMKALQMALTIGIVHESPIK